MAVVQFTVLLLIARICNTIPVVPINGGQGLHGASTVVSSPAQTLPSSTISELAHTSSMISITPSPASSTIGSGQSGGAGSLSLPSDWQDSISWLPGTIPGCTSTQTAIVFGTTSLIPRPCLSGGNGPATMPNTNGGPHPKVPRPQSSVASLGGIEQPGHVGSGGDTGGDTGSQSTVVPEPQTTSANIPAIPIETPRPVSKPTPVSPKSTPAKAQTGSSSAVLNPIAAGGGGPHGGNPVPRPESSVQALDPAKTSMIKPGPESSVQNIGPTDTPVNAPIPVQSTEAVATGSATKRKGGPGGLIPTGQNSAPSLGVPHLAGPTEEPAKGEPIIVSAKPPTVISVGTTAVTADSASHFVIGSQTLIPGSAPITHSGVVLSLPSSGQGVVIGPSTQSIAAPTPHSAPVITLGSTTLTADSSSHFHIGSQILAPGGTVTQGSQVVSLATDASAVVVGSQTHQIVQQTIAPTPEPVITIGGSTLTADSASQFRVGSQTLVPGGPAITNPAGQTVSLAAGGSSVVVNGQTQQVSQQVATLAPVITIGSSRITANSQSQFVVGSQTLAPGFDAITVSHQVISLASSGNAVVFGQRTQAINAPSQFIATHAPIITLGHSTITANSKSEYIVAGQTLHAGSSAIVVSGSTISLAPSAAAVVVNGKTDSLTPQAIHATVAPPVITIGPSAITASKSGQYVVVGQTLVAGGSAITVSGTRISLDSDASDIVIGSSTRRLSPQILALTTEAPAMTVGSDYITAVPPSDYVYGGYTFEPGDMITVSGTIVSLAADDSFLKIGASTSMIPKSDYMFGTQMLEPGHAITVSGTVISLASDDSYLKVGSSTEILHGHTVVQSTISKSTALATSRASIGDFITGSLVQAAPTGGQSARASASGKSAGSRSHGHWSGLIWLGMACAASTAVVPLLL